MLNKYILVTGTAGFIGFHLTKFLLVNNFNIIGIDFIKGFYNDKLKYDRLKELSKFKNFKFYKNDVFNIDKILSIKEKKSIQAIFHLAAQPGVRLSEKYSDDYLSSNINAFTKIIHFASINKISYFYYASSSSVYGNIEGQSENKQGEAKSFYGLTKLLNEKIAENYSSFFDKTKFIGLRFFTVYGPFGRPDMAIYNMTDSIYKNKKIILYNKGLNSRDFTYIDDLIELIYRIYKKRRSLKNNHTIFNTGFGKSYKTIDMLKILEKHTNIKAKTANGSNKLDVYKTKSNFSKLNKFFSENKVIIKKTSLEDGIILFLKWYKKYNKN